MSERKEYIYMHRKTGEILVSAERVDDPDFELLFEIEVKPYGRRGAISAPCTGSPEEEA